MVTDPKPAFLVTLNGRTVRFNSGRDDLFYCKAEDLQSPRTINPFSTGGSLAVPKNQEAIFVTSAGANFTQKK